LYNALITCRLIPRKIPGFQLVWAWPAFLVWGKTRYSTIIALQDCCSSDIYLEAFQCACVAANMNIITGEWSNSVMDASQAVN